MIQNKIQEIYALEQLSNGNTCVHRLHPAVKLLSTTIFILTVVSFDRYAVGRLVPYIFFPTLLMALSETPYSMLLKRFMLALPFCLFAGLSNMIINRAPAFTVGLLTISYGTVSLFTILFKTYLCVMAVLVLVSVTPFSMITNSMRRLRTPLIFVIVFEMTYRYVGVIIEEAYTMYISYKLRSSGTKGIKMKDMGSSIGQLLLRSFDRGERVYNSMKCRGYTVRNPNRESGKIDKGDLLFLAVTCFFCVVFRFIDINTLFYIILGVIG